MTPKPTDWDELHLAENPAVELLQSLGYTFVPPEDLEAERASFKEAILSSHLTAALERLNPWLSESNVAKAVGRVMPDYERRREDLRRCGAGLAW